MQAQVLVNMAVMLLILTGRLWAGDRDAEFYNRRIDHNLAVYRIDSCLYYSYLLAHRYRLSSDAAKLAKTWYMVAFFNLQQEQFTRAQAARQIAEQYAAQGYFSGQLSLYHDIYWGLYHYQSSAYHKAIPYLTKAVKNNRTLPCQLQYLLNLYLGDTWYNLYQREKGNKIIEKTLDKLDTACFAYGLGYYFLGAHDYYEYNPDNCIKHAEKAIRCFESHHIYSKYWVYSYRNIIIALWYKGKTETGYMYFQQLSSILRRGNLLKSFLSYYYVVQGRMNYFKLERRNALNAYLNAYNACNPAFEDKAEIVPFILRCFYYLNQYDKLVQWSDSCAFDMLDNEQKIMVACSHFKTGNPVKAYQICNQIHLHPDDISLYYDAYRLGDFYLAAGIAPKAEYYYKITLQYALTHFGSKGYYTANNYSTIAYFNWYAKADYAQSLYYYHRDVYSLIPVKYSNNYYVLPDISKSVHDNVLANAIGNKAEALYEVAKQRKTRAEKLQDLLASLAHFELSFAVAHRYKMSLNSDEKRYEYADLNKFRYPIIIKVCLELYRETGNRAYASKVFEFMEKSKASLLLSTVRGTDAYKMGMLPDTLKKLEDRLWTKVEEIIASNFWGEPTVPGINPGQVDQNYSTLIKLEHQQDSLIRLFKQKYPAYYNARYNAEVVSVDSLQKLLKPNEAMLQYSLSEDRLVIFMLTRNEFKIITDTIGRQFFFDIEAYRKFLSHFSYNELDDTITRKFTALSNRLYNRLIQPFERNLTGKSLLIIPDDVLTEVPFEALITSPTTEVSYRNLPYLLRKHNINYSYSATLYAMNRHKAHIVNPRLLAVAPDYTPMKLMRLSKKNNPTVPNDSLSLSPIPGTFDEVKNISHIFNGKTLIKNRATEQRFKAVASQYDILHLAMHGITNNEYPMLSRLVFTPAKDSVNEGFLNTYEIYNMQLNAPLVVLSACNTGYGKLHKGEGIISLARGFYTAGAKSIVMALWPVEDKTSSELMANFYSNLASSQCISDALQNAKITYIDHADEISAHPYFWAGYILTGNPSVTYEIRKPKTKYYLLGAIGLLAIIVFVLGKRRIFLKKDEKDLFHFPQ